jgi:uncharacterized protein YjbI with pentapeptide repeats
MAVKKSASPAAKPVKARAFQRSPADLPPDMLDLDPLSPDAILTGAPLQDGFLDGSAVPADFSARKLPGLTGTSLIFQSVNFSGCELRRLHLRDVRFVQCDFSNAILRGFEATRVEFIDCRLTGVAAVECRWQDVLIEGCEAAYSRFADARFRACEFRSTNFAESDFRGADFGTDHATGGHGCLFSQCSLQRADLSHAKLYETDLRGANLDGMIVGRDDVRGAIVNATQAMDLARLLGLVIK